MANDKDKAKVDEVAAPIMSVNDYLDLKGGFAVDDVNRFAANKMFAGVYLPASEWIESLKAKGITIA